jgi:hypothetical protein
MSSGRQERRKTVFEVTPKKTSYRRSRAALALPGTYQKDLMKKLAVPKMCMADVHICQCILMTYAWLKTYIVRILRLFGSPGIYKDTSWNKLRRRRKANAFSVNILLI